MDFVDDKEENSTDPIPVYSLKSSKVVFSGSNNKLSPVGYNHPRRLFEPRSGSHDEKESLGPLGSINPLSSNVYSSMANVMTPNSIGVRKMPEIRDSQTKKVPKSSHVTPVQLIR